MQTKLPIKKLEKKDIQEIAYTFVREQYGSIPSVGEATLSEGVWTVPINANYPRILFSDIKQEVDKIRFMGFKNIGILEILEDGKIKSKPQYWEIAGIITKKLKDIRESVQKALVKVAADKFSLLTFPDHMFTPIQDILSWLLVEGTLKTEQFLENVYEDKKEKYLQNIKILEEVNIIKTENGLILPDNSLIEIEMNKGLSNSEKLAAALTLFYQRGYEHLDTISSFLGPHLIISGFAYTESIECNEILAIKQEEFRSVIEECYSNDKSKLTKLPRYILQLESIGVLILSKRRDKSWEPNPELFERLRGEEDIIVPIQNLILR